MCECVLAMAGLRSRDRRRASHDTEEAAYLLELPTSIDPHPPLLPGSSCRRASVIIAVHGGVKPHPTVGRNDADGAEHKRKAGEDLPSSGLLCSHYVEQIKQNNDWDWDAHQPE